MIKGIIVTRNEADRYLRPCLEWASKFLDSIFICDDQSTDNTVEIAHNYGNTYTRPSDSPSFLEHEGQFRYNAWQKFEKFENPVLGDWIFSFDADEFMVSATNRDIRDSLEQAISSAERQNKGAVLLNFPEIFKVEDGKFYYRTDGLWGTIRGTRLFKYRRDGVFKDKPMGCGSEPTYVVESGISVDSQDLNVLHLGYAREEDQKAKYERYSSLYDHGHNDKHIQSIITTPTLKEWEGQLPDVSF